MQFITHLYNSQHYSDILRDLYWKVKLHIYVITGPQLKVSEPLAADDPVKRAVLVLVTLGTGRVTRRVCPRPPKPPTLPHNAGEIDIEADIIFMYHYNMHGGGREEGGRPCRCHSYV